MSLEVAKEFVTKSAQGDGAVRALIEAAVPEGVAQDAARQLIADAAVAAGWDFTAAELAEAAVLGQEVDDEELKAVAGGEQAGGCTEDYYTRPCSNTVDGSGWCWSGDWCAIIDNIYHSKNQKHTTGPVIIL